MRPRSRVYPAFAAKVRPTPFAPGVIKGTGTMAPADWMVRWADGLEPTPPNLTLRDLLGGGGDTRLANLPIPHRAVPVAARQGLGRSRLQGNARRLAVTERAIQVLGRRSAGSVQELGGDHEPAQPAQGHCREHPASRAAAAGGDEGDLGQQARLTDPAAHGAAARQDRAGAGAERRTIGRSPIRWDRTPASPKS